MFSHSFFMFMLPALVVHAAPAASGSVAELYHQCGGANWTGATDCASGSYCKSQNDYYYQCVATDDDVASAGSSATTTLAVKVTSSANLSSSVEASSTLATEVTSSATLATSSLAAKVVSSSAIASSSVEASSSAVTSSSSSAKASSAATSSSSSSAKASSSASADDLVVVEGGFSGDVNTTRYWDCCVPSYAWEGRSTGVKTPVNVCDASGNKFTNQSFSSGCTGGDAYMCSDQSPWAVNDDLAYGFIAASITNSTNESLGCICLKMTFTTQAVKGKVMVVQVTNSGSDDTGNGGNHIDIAIPASGVGYYTEGCPSEFGSGYSWGEQYGGVESKSDCANVPEALQSGCEFRFDWMQGSSNPSAHFEQVVCPSAITDVSGCVRNDGK